jgi:putative protein-disulfide isomerase
MKDKEKTLLYIHDPMCSWCWGFRPVWQEVQQKIDSRIEIRYLLGGLAADTDEPMPDEMRMNIRDNWQRIQQEIPGTVFNYDFWTQCSPRRSTYPACRAIIACRMQQPDLESDMLLLIQQAYYLLAKNPSDLDVLVTLAGQLGLNTQQFADDIQSQDCQNTLMQEIEYCRKINIYSFPSLVLKQEKSYTSLDIDYNSSANILSQIL